MAPETPPVETGTGTDAIVFDDVSMSYPTKRHYVNALTHISLNVPQGRFVSVVGPSGCGKSTLMMLAAGLRKCSGGGVLVDGMLVTGPQGGTGIVFQNHTLLDWRTSLENVLLQIDLRGLRRRDYRDQALELLGSVGLGGFEHRHPYELSGGMRQRVALCRALIHDPQVMLMDEPFGALDALTRDQMMLDLQAIWLERRKTVLFITHSIPEAVFLSDQVVVMTPRPGRIDDVIDIELPRPRTLDSTTGPEFNTYVHAIRQVFERRGVIHDTPGVTGRSA